MDIFTVYIALFFIIFLIMPVIYYTLRFILWFLLEYCGCGKQNSERDDDHERNARRRSSHWGLFYDRQGNIFTISDETSANPSANRYPDFFYLEPSSDEAARIRAQLEKDDKDLPSYDEVMRMPVTPLTPPANVMVAAPSLGNTTSSTTISSSNSTPTQTAAGATTARPPPPPPPDMTVPPYSETPPSYQVAAAISNDTTTATVTPATASTSRGASVTIPINNSLSNTSV